MCLCGDDALWRLAYCIVLVDQTAICILDGNIISACQQVAEIGLGYTRVPLILIR